MAEAQRLQLPIISDEEEAKEENPAVNVNATNREITVSRSGKYKRWLRVVLYTIFLLCGQSVGTLLGRLYYEKGGNSKWLAALVQLAGTGLFLALQQLAFRKVVKRQAFTDVMDMIIFPSLIASSAILVGFLASGDWKGLNREMKEYELGNFSYVMILLWTAICWAVLAIGAVGLVFEVSALFCNAISVFGLPIVPIIAVFVFHDKMDGIKVISMVLAIWGFISYVYQHYLDDYKSKTEKGKTSGNL